MSDTRLPLHAVLIRNRTKILEQTKLLTDGENWQVTCSCGWKTPLYRRRKTAQHRFDQHVSREALGA